MITIQGTRRMLCDRLSRRALLQIGGLGALQMGFGNARRLAADMIVPTPSRESGFGKAKSCILLFLYGSPPQHETFDPKPDAPAEIQGEMKAISTTVPGLTIGEGLPRIAQLVDKLTIARSLTHEYPLHGVAYAVSGLPIYTTDLETRAQDARHWPFLGSIVDYAFAQQPLSGSTSVPRQMALPWMLNSKTDLLVNAGPFAAFLGTTHDPVWTDFVGSGTHKVPKYTDDQQQEFVDPFGGITAAGRLTLSKDTTLQEELSVERLGFRQSLLAQFNRSRMELDRRLSGRGFDGPREHAMALLASSAIQRALDVSLESPTARDSYGMTLFGQSCLAARRLVEAGSKFVSVFWDGYGQFANCAWDTHNNHFPRLKEYLLPGFDRAYSGLILDLERRGLLDETLVLCLSEHGRTPQIDSKPRGAGRHHWSRAYSAVFAGGGMAKGRVVGRTDRIAGEVTDVPLSPKDILATALHLLGIDPNLTVRDSLGRPLRVVGSGDVRRELIG